MYTSVQTPRIRVLVVDDHDRIRSLLCRLLREQTDLDVIGEAVSGAEALMKAEELLPDVVLLDISLPDIDGFEVAVGMRAIAPSTEVLIVSDYEGRSEHFFSTGARGYLLKPDAASELATAVRTVNKKEQYLSIKLRPK